MKTFFDFLNDNLPSNCRFTLSKDVDRRLWVVELRNSFGYQCKFEVTPELMQQTSLPAHILAAGMKEVVNHPSSSTIDVI